MSAAVLQLLKTCGRCGLAKPVAEFQRRNDRPEDRDCRACWNERRREWRRNNPEKLRAQEERKLTRQKQDQRRWLFNRVRARALRSGLPFELTLEDIFIPKHCPVLGLELLPLGRIVRGAERDRIASVDRLVPELGYVRGNVAVISLRANRLKNDATAAELEQLAAWMRARGAK